MKYRTLMIALILLVGIDVRSQMKVPHWEVAGDIETSTGNIIGASVAVQTTSWREFAAVAYGSCQSTSFWVNDGDSDAEGLYCEDATKSLYFPVPYAPGTVITRLRAKYDGLSATDGIAIRMVARDETEATSVWTVVTAQVAYTTSVLSIATYDITDVTMTDDHSYAIEIESRIGSDSVILYSIGIETSIRYY